MPEFSFRHIIFNNLYLPLTDIYTSINILFSIPRFTALFIACTFISILLISLGLFKSRESKITLYLILAMLMYEMYVLKSVVKVDDNNLRVIEKEWMDKFLESKSFFIDKKVKLSEDKAIESENEVDFNQEKEIKKLSKDNPKSSNLETKNPIKELSKDNPKSVIFKVKKTNNPGIENPFSGEKKINTNEKLGNKFPTETLKKTDKKVIIKDPQSNENTILKIEKPRNNKSGNLDQIKGSNQENKTGRKQKESINYEESKNNQRSGDIYNARNRKYSKSSNVLSMDTSSKYDRSGKETSSKYDRSGKNLSWKDRNVISNTNDRKNLDNLFGQNKEEKSLNFEEDDEYLNAIKSQIQLYQKSSYLLNRFIQSLHNSKKEIKQLLDEFKLNYKNLISASQKIEPTLLSMNIPIGIQKYEIEELENEINSKFDLNLSNEQVISKIEDRNIKFELNKQKESLNPQKTHNLMDENTNLLQLIFLCECLFSFLFLITYIFKLNNLKILRFIAIFILSINILIGVYTLVLAQLMFQKCNIKKSEGCKYNTYKLDEITSLFNLAPQNNISAIQNEFNTIASSTNKSVLILDSYIKNNLKSKIGLKIFIFENLIDKLKFIEADFDSIFSNSVDKKQFYSDLDLLIRSLERIKNNINIFNINQLLDIYKDIVTTNVYFNKEKNEVSNKIKRIVKNESDKYKKMNKKECEKNVELVCRKEREMDVVSMFLVFFSLILGLLFLF